MFVLKSSISVKVSKKTFGIINKQGCLNTFKCLINGGVKINRGSEIFVKFIKRGVGISKNLLKSVMNKKRDINV